MSTDGTLILPDAGAGASGRFGFKPGLEHVTLCFALFLLVFPPIALLVIYFSRGTILLSLPLLLMFVCGIFGTRLSLYLVTNRAR